MEERIKILRAASGGGFTPRLKAQKTTQNGWRRAGVVPNPEFTPRNTTTGVFEFWSLARPKDIVTEPNPCLCISSLPCYSEVLSPSPLRVSRSLSFSFSLSLYFSLSLSLSLVNLKHTTIPGGGRRAGNLLGTTLSLDAEPRHRQR